MSLIAWYPLNGDTKDYSGNENHGLAVGSPRVSDFGKVGRCYTCGQNIGIIRTGVLPVVKSQTISFWIKIPSKPTSIKNILWGHGTNRTILQLNTDNTMSWYYGTTGGNIGYISTSHKLTYDEWLNISMVYDFGSIQIYLNGIPDGQPFNHGGEIVRSSINFCTSYQGDHTNGRTLDADINDVRIYDHALTQDEIYNISQANIIHYKCNEDREATINLARPQDIISNPTPGSYSPGWDASKHTDAIVVNGWSTGYNSGVSSASIGYHARWVYDDDGVTPIMMFPNRNNDPSLGLGVRWLGIAGACRDPQALMPGETYTLSAYQKVSQIHQRMRIGLYHRLEGATGNTFGSCIATVSPNASTHTWERREVTFTLPTNINLAVTPSIYVYGNMSSSLGDLWVKDVQLERKSRASTFAKESASPRVLDMSPYGNHTDELNPDTTPMWSSDSKLGEGCYLFDGVKTRMKTSNLNLSSEECTLSAWVKPQSRQASSDRDIILKLADAATFYLTIDTSGRLSCYSYNHTPSGYHNSNEVIPLNEWTHIAATWSADRLKMYINGKKVREIAIVKAQTVNTSTALEIGHEGSGRMFHGGISDMKVYTSALTEDEISKLYTSRASVTRKGVLSLSTIKVPKNLFDVAVILKRRNELGINTRCGMVSEDGIDAFAMSPIDFYASRTYHSIFPENYFKTGTRYKICVTIKTNLYHNGNEVPGGLRIIYTDGTSDHTFVASTTNKWRQIEMVTPEGKTIESIFVYYYIGVVFHIDPRNTYIKEFIPKMSVNSNGTLHGYAYKARNFKMPLSDYSTWKLDSFGGWLLNGTPSENEIIMYGNPSRELDIMWATLQNDEASNADGGFNSPLYPIDSSKLYRFSVWIRRENCGTGSGRSYLGIHNYNSGGSNLGVTTSESGVTTTNHYFRTFLYTDYGGYPHNNWVLMVAFAYPHNHEGNFSAVGGGVYAVDGRRLGSVVNCKWHQSATLARIRSYLYYSTKVDERQFFYRPRIDLCDGTEPTLEALLGCYDHPPLTNPNGVYYPNGRLSIGKNGTICASSFNTIR